MEFNTDNNIILNDDVMLIIVKYLNLSINDKLILSTVSQQFNRVVNQSLESIKIIDRQTIFGKNTSNAISSSTMAKIIRKCVNANHISLKNLAIEDNDGNANNIVMNAITQSCRHLESIDFDSLDVNQHFREFAKECHKIKKIASKKINDVSLDHIITSPFLESIDLCHNNTITGLTFNKFGKNLNELLLFSGKRITDTAINCLLLGNGKRLKKLSIYITSDDQFEQICENFTELTHFSFQFAHPISNLHHISFLTNLTHVSLDVKYNFQFSVNQFQQLIQALNGENILGFDVTHVNYFSDNCVTLICNSFPNLVKLSLNKFSNITDCSMSSIARLNNLSRLSLMSCIFIRFGVTQVIRSCRQLRHLNLQHCNGIDKEVLLAFTQKCEENTKQNFVLDVRNTGIKIDKNDHRFKLLNLQLFIDYDDHKDEQNAILVYDESQRNFDILFQNDGQILALNAAVNEEVMGVENPVNHQIDNNIIEPFEDELEEYFAPLVEDPVDDAMVE